MKKQRGTILVGTVLLVSMLLGGCGGKSSSVQNSGDVAASKEHVYKAELLEFSGIDSDNISGIYYLEDKIVVKGQRWEEVAGGSQEGTEMSPIEPRAWDATEKESVAEEVAEEVIEAVAIDDEEIYECIEDLWPDYPTKDDFFFDEEEY